VLTRRRFVGMALAAAAVPGRAWAQRRVIVDGAGRRVEVPGQARRVFAAGGPASIFVYTLAPDTLLGWTRALTPEERPWLPPRYAELPALGRLTGRGNTANVEVVLATRPDVVLDFGTIGGTYASSRTACRNRRRCPTCSSTAASRPRRARTPWPATSSRPPSRRTSSRATSSARSRTSIGAWPRGGGPARPDRVVDPVADLGESLDDEPSGLGQRRAPRRALAGARLGEWGAQRRLRPPQVSPGVTIGPTDLPRRAQQ
jgi:hypothetical protein